MALGQFQVENDTLVSEVQLDSDGNPIVDEDVNNKMFVVVRNTKSAQNNLDYKLKKGDIIKLGRIKFNVKDFKSKFVSSSEKKNLMGYEEEKRDMDRSPHKFENHNNQSFDSLTQEFEEECIEIECGAADESNTDIQCKVCWETHSTVENPLLNSC